MTGCRVSSDDHDFPEWFSRFPVAIYGLLLVEPIRELLAPAKARMPLLHPEGCHTTPATVVVPRHRSWVELLVASFLWELSWYLLVPWELAQWEGLSGLSQLRSSWTLVLKCMVSSETGTFLSPVRCNQGQQKQGLFWKSLRKPWPPFKRGLPSLAKRKHHKPYEEFSFNLCLYVYMLTYLHYRGLGGRQSYDSLWILLLSTSSYTNLCPPSPFSYQVICILSQFLSYPMNTSVCSLIMPRS